MLNETDRKTLLKAARRAITAVAEHNSLEEITIEDYSSALQQDGACFVTLTINGQLRGCIGTLQAHRPLIIDVIENAQASANRDPRFTPLRAEELADTHIEISILTTPEPMAFNSEADLLEQIAPFKDGLILEEGANRGTFLPLVWESLPDKTTFLKQLKRKAGLPEDYWSDTIAIRRYRTEILEETTFN